MIFVYTLNPPIVMTATYPSGGFPPNGAFTFNPPTSYPGYESRLPTLQSLEDLRASRQDQLTCRIYLRILPFCDWYSLMSLSRTSGVWRAAVQLEVRDRMESMVDPFVPNGNLNSFMCMLEDTQAAVVGSVARRLLAAGSEYMRERLEHGYLQWDYSFDLNILVPSSSFDNCVRWFRSQGYVVGYGTVKGPYKNSVAELARGYIPSTQTAPFKFAFGNSTQLRDFRDALRRSTVRA